MRYPSAALLLSCVLGSPASANLDRVPSTGNYASPHAGMAGVHQAVERETSRMSTPAAGGVQMCAKDMATWMLFQLGDGTHGGTRILSAEALQESHAPQIVVPTTPRSARRDRSSLLRPTASAGTCGTTAATCCSGTRWRRRAECVHGTAAGEGIGRGVGGKHVEDVREWIFGEAGEPDPGLLRPRGARLSGGVSRAGWEKERKHEADERTAVEKASVKRSAPTVALDRYAGAYRDELGLDVKVTLEGKTLALQYVNSERAPLEYWHGDTFRVLWKRKFAAQERAAFVTFGVDEEGEVGALHFEVFRERVEAERAQGGK